MAKSIGFTVSRKSLRISYIDGVDLLARYGKLGFLSTNNFIFEGSGGTELVYRVITGEPGLTMRVVVDRNRECVAGIEVFDAIGELQARTDLYYTAKNSMQTGIPSCLVRRSMIGNKACVDSIILSRLQVNKAVPPSWFAVPTVREWFTPPVDSDGQVLW